jgi:hypothetical protein
MAPQRPPPICLPATKPRLCLHASSPGGCALKLIDACAYVHSRKELNAHPLYRASRCPMYALGRCSDDAFCGKYHEESDRRSPPSSALGPRSPRVPEMCTNGARRGAAVCLKPMACDFCHTEEEFLAIYKTRPCWRYRSPEGCNRSETCGFYHDEAERRAGAADRRSVAEEEDKAEEEEEYADVTEELSASAEAPPAECEESLAADAADAPFTLFRYGTSWVYL